MKTVKFVGSSLDDINLFPADARRQVGFQPMSSVGHGVYEIRIHESGEYRVFYLAKREDAVYVLHAFQKKTQKTRQSDIDLAKQRLKMLEDY